MYQYTRIVLSRISSLPLCAGLCLTLCLLLAACRGGDEPDGSGLGEQCEEYFERCCSAGDIQASCDEVRLQVDTLLDEEGGLDQAEAACEVALNAAESVGLCSASDEPDGGPDGDGDADIDQAYCRQYLECLAHVDELVLAAALEAYGSDGSCWSTLTSSQCSQACFEGLRSLRELPEIADDPMCAECSPDLHCIDDANPRCHQGTCVECVEDGDCPSGGCDVAQHRCVSCTHDDHCSGTLPACDTAAQSCVACTRDEHCGGDRPACDRESHRCIGCSRDEHCPPEAPACVGATGQCIECTSDEHCSGNRPACDMRNNCVVCQAHDHCPPDRPVCFGVLAGTPSCRECTIFNEGICTDSEKCRDGECVPLTCDDIDRECGVELFDDGVELECGGCDSPHECDLRPMYSWWDDPLWVHICGLPIDAFCDPREPDACGNYYRCVWDQDRDEDIGECVEDVTGRNCEGESSTICRYEGHLGGVTNFGQCIEGDCTPLCLIDEHCLSGESCVDLSGGVGACE